MDLSSNIYTTLNRLCNIKSTSGTMEEADAAQKIYSIIDEIPYFKEHQENIILHNIEGDPYNRKFISAMYEGCKSQKVVVLLSHFDVVGIEEFGHLKDFAYNPEEYTKRLKNEDIPQKAKEDLDSGEWLFGRGTMDMKCGLAIHTEIIRYISESNIDIGGNILLLTVPDEENSSAGMLSAAKYLSQLKDMGYEFQCVINSEPYFPEFPGDECKYIYTGTIGKLLPLICFAGIETHAGEPFNGISSSLMSSMTTTLIEGNTKLCEAYGDYTSPPPVCLKQEDLKSLYSVSTPNFSYAYYNYLTLTSSPGDVLEKIKKVCTKAFDMAVDKMKTESKNYTLLSGKRESSLNITPNVITYSELCSIVERKNIDIEKIKNSYKNKGIDTRDVTVRIISDMLKLIPELRPVMVISIAPPYYPHRMADSNFKNILDVCSKVMERSKAIYNEDMVHKDFFPGLCDFSYLGFDNPDNYYTLKSNMPVMDAGYELPVKALSNINIGGINIGVKGKDVHKYTERLNLPYSLKVTPDLVFFAIREFLY